MAKPRAHLPARGRRRGGFTLMEAALVTVVIGVCAVATLRLMAAGTQANDAAAEMTVAVALANHVHDMMAGLPVYDPDDASAFINREGTVAAYDNVTDFTGQTFNPPRDAARQQISAYANWTQAITVQSVGEDDLTTVKTNSATENAARVTVTISHAGRQVYQTTWVVADTAGG